MRHFRKGDVQYFESIQKQTRRYRNSRFLDVMTRLTSKWIPLDSRTSRL